MEWLTLGEMNCPSCSTFLEDYSHSEGGWCPKCEDWWPDDIIQERMEEF